MSAVAVSHAAASRVGVRRWEALGTYVYLAVDDAEQAAPAEALAVEVLRQVDRACSRFRPDSDLSRVNASPGTWVPVDPLLAAATSVALEAAGTTDGLVDPCLGRSMVLLGYDVTLSAVRRRDPASLPGPHPPPHDPDAWRHVRVDPEGAVRIPHGCALDLGATAKAWAADLVAAAVADRLGTRTVVSLGGDVRIVGDGPPWPVRVTERPEDQEGQTVLLGGGGLATSSTRARRWRRGDTERHHLLDPRTGLPAEEVWRTATATGPTCVAANVATTAAVVLGAGAVDWLRAHDVTARLVDHTGRVARVGGWPAHDPDPNPNPDLDTGRHV